jgi:signal transduction histidine kinase
MVIVDVGILWMFLGSALVILMQAQAIRLARTNRELAGSEAALRARNADLDAANQRLGEMDVLKNRFLAGVSHDLRRPLHALLSEARLLQRFHAQDPAMVQRLATAIVEEGELLARLVDTLPERAHADWHVLEANESKVDPTTVLREAVATIQSVADCQNVELRVDAPANLSPVWANHERLVHALVLLLDSAVTYSPRGGEVRAAVGAAGPEVVFRIEQPEGQGLPLSKVQEVLESRRNADGSGGEAKGGFTLALCRDIVESHRGRFWIDSRADVGTAFYVALPAVSYEPRAAAYSTERAADAGAAAASPSISTSQTTH